jgi:tetratricopeptide (TPR) repeat protein
MIFERAVLLLLVALPVLAVPAGPDDSLSRARNFYYATYYEEALDVLDQMTADGLVASELQTVREYRVLCLLALDRAPEAEKILEQMIESDPFYQPARESAAPAMLTAVARTRRRVIPALLPEAYGKARIDFDNRRYAESTARLERVLRLVKEANLLAGGPDLPNVRDIERLASSLLVESRAAGDRRPPSPARSIYSKADAGVTAAVPVRQDIPPWSAGMLDGSHLDGMLELVVDSDGSVRSARMVVPIHPAYDLVLVDAARKWRFRPASKEGRPVAYAETVAIRVAPLRHSGTPRR